MRERDDHLQTFTTKNGTNNNRKQQNGNIWHMICVYYNAAYIYHRKYTAKGTCAQ